MSQVGGSYQAFLFDMDGTVLTSLAATERIWTEWALAHGLDPETFLPTIHGVRAEDTIARLGRADLDARAEAERIIFAESRDMDGVEALHGADRFIRALPTDRWAIVTSAPRNLALRRLTASGLPIPPMLVAAEDVVEGKPAPEGYLLAATKLGVSPADCVVFEDSPAGVEAAETAGMSVIVVTSCQPHSFRTGHPSTPDYGGLHVRPEGTGWSVLASEEWR